MTNTAGQVETADSSSARKTGGQLWAIQEIDTNNTIEGVNFVSPQVGWAAGGGGTLLHTNDGGQTWGFQTSATVNTLDAIFMLNDTAGWAVGAGGAVVATVDGASWEVQESRVPNSNGMPEPVWDVHFADENVGIAAAEFGVILRTKDGGITWGTYRTSSGCCPSPRCSHAESNRSMDRRKRRYYSAHN